MPSSPMSPQPRQVAPNLIARVWWKKNSVVLLVGIIVLIGIGIGAARLLFLFQKPHTPAPVSQQPPTPEPQTPQKTIVDVQVPTAVGEDAFYLKPNDFDSMGMGPDSEIVLTSKADMDTDSVLFHLSLNPVFAYDVVSATPREIHIVPKAPLKEGAIYQFQLPTYYMAGDKRVDRLYKWAYQVKDPVSLISSVPADQQTNVAAWSSIVLTMNTDDIAPADLKRYVTIQPSPAIQPQYTHHWNQYLIAPQVPWQPKTSYTITIKKGLPLQKSNTVVSDDIHFTFQTGDPTTLNGIQNPENFIPDSLRVTPSVQQRMAQDEFGLYPVTTQASVPPLNLDHYHDAMVFGINELLPFEKLPLGTMDVYIVPQETSALWQHLLKKFQQEEDIHGVISGQLVRALFSQTGLGKPDLLAPTQSEQESITYPDKDLSVTELLALSAYAGQYPFDPAQLKSYFESVYFSYDATSNERAQAAFGLASLGQPYVQQQVNLLNDPHLTPMDRLYLGLGLDRLGASEYTVVIYRDILKNYKVKTTIGSFIQTVQSPTRTRYATILESLAGFAFDREDADLKTYLQQDSDLPWSFLDTLYVTRQLMRGTQTSVPFRISFDHTNTNITLDSDHRIFGVNMTAGALKALKVDGQVDALKLLIAY